MTSDGTFTYAYDHENRLIEVVPTVPDTTTMNTRLTFEYDYMNRRVQKKEWKYDGSTWTAGYGTYGGEERYIYDRWNVVQAIRSDIGPSVDATDRMYTWGLDLSGTVHGAGGVGGLLATVHTERYGTSTGDTAYWHTYDGNGNVGQLIDPATVNRADRAA